MGKILNVQLGVEEFSHAPRQTMTPDTHTVTRNALMVKMLLVSV